MVLKVKTKVDTIYSPSFQIKAMIHPCATDPPRMSAPYQQSLVHMFKKTPRGAAGTILLEEAPDIVLDFKLFTSLFTGKSITECPFMISPTSAKDPSN